MSREPLTFAELQAKYETSLGAAKAQRAVEVEANHVHLAGYWSGRVDTLEQLVMDLKRVESWR